MKIIELAALFARLIRQSKAQLDAKGNPLPCSRLNTFAVLYDESHIEAGNLGKSARYKQADYFFSRKWELTGANSNKIEFEYPAMFMWEENEVGTSPSEGKARFDTTLRFVILDKMQQGDKPCINCDPCESRTDEQLQDDIKTLRDKFMLMLDKVYYYNLYLANNPVGSGYYHTAEIAQMTADGVIDDADERHPLYADFVGAEVQYEYATAVYGDYTAALYWTMTYRNEVCGDGFELEFNDKIKPSKNLGCC